MFVHTRAAPRTTHWIVDLMIAILAFAFAVALTRSAWGQDTATKIPAVPSDNGYSSMAWADEASYSDDYRATLALVRIVDLHRAGEMEEMEAMWAKVSLPHESVIWKQLSLGAVDIHRANWKAAEAHFNEAAQLAPRHPLPAYYIAGLRMHRAEILDDRYDNAGPDVSSFVAARPAPAVEPVDAVMMRDAAIAKYQEAVDLGPVRDQDRSLLNVAWVLPGAHSMEMPLTVPTVEDLMDAMGVADWETDAHWRLGGLLMDKGSLTEAEYHWDAAADRGKDLRREYRELSRRYRVAGDSMDAVRCTLKSMRFGGPYLGS